MWLGLRILMHNRLRFLASTAGVAMAVVIMFVEAGFFFGVLDSQANIAQRIDGDLVVIQRFRTHLDKWNRLPLIRLHQIAALPGVADVIPLYKDAMGLTNPQTGAVKRIIVYAFPPDRVPLKLGDDRAIAHALRQRDTVLFDRLSRNIYGPLEVGKDLLLDQHSFRLAGLVSLGPNIINDGAVFMSQGNWLSQDPRADPIMGVIRLRPGADPEQTRRAAATIHPEDFLILSPAQLHQREVLFTVRAAPIGILFGIGLIAGLVIGISICYQVLFNEIADNFRQYATLRAMGFGNGFLRRVILQQALVLSLGGFAVGCPLALALYDVIAGHSALIMSLTGTRALLVMGLTVSMCIGAGLLAVRHVLRVDPAELY